MKHLSMCINHKTSSSHLLLIFHGQPVMKNGICALTLKNQKTITVVSQTSQVTGAPLNYIFSKWLSSGDRSKCIIFYTVQSQKLFFIIFFKILTMWTKVSDRSFRLESQVKVVCILSHPETTDSLISAFV